MFTGIIEEIGSLAQVKHSGQTLLMKVNAKLIVNDLKIGDSIAVNGVCLTITEFNSTSFTADVMPITYQTTNLAKLRTGDSLNLERAMMANGRFGGHIVSGHVDGIALIISKTRNQNAEVYRLKLAAALIVNCISKGSIALDGTSLTIGEVGRDWISVALIPHTQTMSILGKKGIGAVVNVECDVLAKQLVKINEVDNSIDKSSKITDSFLQKHGYIY